MRSSSLSCYVQISMLLLCSCPNCATSRASAPPGPTMNSNALLVSLPDHRQGPAYKPDLHIWLFTINWYQNWRFVPVFWNIFQIIIRVSANGLELLVGIVLFSIRGPWYLALRVCLFLRSPKKLINPNKFADDSLCLCSNHLKSEKVRTALYIKAHLMLLKCKIHDTNWHQFNQN